MSGATSRLPQTDVLGTFILLPIHDYYAFAKGTELKIEAYCSILAPVRRIVNGLHEDSLGHVETNWIFSVHELLYVDSANASAYCYVPSNALSFARGDKEAQENAHRWLVISRYHTVLWIHW